MSSPANKINDLSISVNYIEIYKKSKCFGLNFSEIMGRWGVGEMWEWGGESVDQ